MDTRKVKCMMVRDRAAAWSDSAPNFLFSSTGTKAELKAELHRRHQGHVSFFLQDSDGDFAEWDEPIALPASGTVCVKVATDTFTAGNLCTMTVLLPSTHRTCLSLGCEPACQTTHDFFTEQSKSSRLMKVTVAFPGQQSRVSIGLSA